MSMMSDMFGMSGNMPMRQMMPQPTNPMAQMAQFMQAMQNPAAFLRQKFPDIPAGMNDPNQIYNYLQQTRGFTDQQAQQSRQQMQSAMNQYQNPYGGR